MLSVKILNIKAGLYKPALFFCSVQAVISFLYVHEYHTYLFNWWSNINIVAIALGDDFVILFKKALK